MTTEPFLFSGGWLLVSNVVIDSSSSPPLLSAVTSYLEISSYHSNKMVLTKSAIHELWTHFPFTQLRFHCRKQHHGRTFHVTTAANSTGEAVVQYFSGQTDVQPASCGSYVRMEDDNSKLAGVCHRWGGVGRWGWGRDKDRLYNIPAIAFHPDLLLFRTQVDGSISVCECDDFNVGVSSGDFWKIFVR